jgi:hypothetical protein
MEFHDPEQEVGGRYFCEIYRFCMQRVQLPAGDDNDRDERTQQCLRDNTCLLFFIRRYAPSSFSSLPIGVDYVHQHRINQPTVDRRLIRLDTLEPEAR